MAEQTWVEGNRRIFDQPETASGFPTLGGWLDPGEQAAVLGLAGVARSRPVLDVGVGAGRTTGLLRLLSDEYVGVDYAPAMVERARRAHPGADIRLGDARDLGDLPDGHFALVLCSNNAVDALDRAGRARAMAAMAAKVAPGGALVVQSLNRDGKSYGERPFQWHRPGNPPDLSVRHLARRAFHYGRHPAAPVQRAAAFREGSRLAEDHGEWALAPLAAHDFTLLVHFTTLGAFRRELAAVGLDARLVLDAETGLPVSEGAEHDGADSFYAIARKADVPGPDV